MEALETRIKRLEDIEEIRKLKATYCDLCDAGLIDASNLEALLAHFTNDAHLDFGMGDGSVFDGGEGMKIFFGSVVPSAVSFCMHMVHNSVIEVEGDRATGRWYFEAPTTNAMTRKAQWMAGRYVEEYVREDGRWKFASIKTEWNYVAPYDEGWGDATGDPRSRATGG
jgi:ketosteroid isomerase-like protein